MVGLVDINPRGLSNGFFGGSLPKNKPIAAAPAPAPVVNNGNPNNPVIYTGANATQPSTVIESQIDPNIPLTANQSSQVKAGNSLVDVDNRKSGILNSLNTPQANIAPANTQTTAPIMQSSAAPVTQPITPIATAQTPASNTPIVNTANMPTGNSSLYSDQINPATDTVEGRINRL